MYVKVRVIAGAKDESVHKISDNRFDLRVKEKAERNRANARVLELIAREFHLPAKKVRIVNGHQSPSKMLAVDND